ncbi:MAG TPA: hypothetical protein VEG34_13225 [Thermoanaerobaculia bacterium]|nr:hypothetical protein [Thermoanaerobaculia bacterium]
METDVPSPDLLTRFEAGQVSASELGHRQHLQVAWLYLGRLGPEQTAQAVREGIRRLAAANGVPQLYHETVTRVWIHLVAWARAASGAATFEDLLEAHPELLDRALPQRFYSAERLQSPEAKAGWVEPDRSALPALRDRMPGD